MKKLLPVFALCLLLFGMKANAEETQYVVKLNPQVRLFSMARTPVVQLVSKDELQDYLDAGIVELYAPNVPVSLCSAETDWNLEHIKATFPNKIGCDGSGVTVAVIDSGIQEIGILSGRVLPGCSYTQIETEDEYMVERGDDTSDTNGHGTFVSGIIVGTAENVSILPLKTFEDSRTTLICILQAIYDACVLYEADVINMSLTLELDSFDASTQAEAIALLNDFVSNATNSGAIVIAAVGNKGSEAVLYPAGCEDAIGVGAVAQNYEAYPFSQRNESVYIVAPGQDVISTAIPGFTDNDGTSFATPHVSGLAAIAKSMKPDISLSEFKALLAETAINLGDDAGYDTTFGHGLIDCEAFAKALIGNQSIYLSPIHQAKTETEAVIYNNTETPMTIWCLYASYNDTYTTLNSYTPIETTIEAGDLYTFKNPYESGRVRYMVLQNQASLKPLTKDRIK